MKCDHCSYTTGSLWFLDIHALCEHPVDVEAPAGSPAPGTPFVAGNGSTDSDSDSPSESSIGSRTESARVDRQGEGGLEPRREGEPRAGAETRTTAEAATGGGGGALGGAGERAPAVQAEAVPAARPVRVTRPPRQAGESEARPLCMKKYCISASDSSAQLAS